MRTVGIFVVLIAAVLFAFILEGGRLRLATEILYLGLFAVSFNFLFNYMGLLSFGHNATYGVAAYAFAIVAARIPGMPVYAIGVIAVAASALIGFLGSLLFVRLKGGYFALMTMAFCQLLFFCALKFYGLTRGEDGLMVLVQTPELPFVPEGALSNDQSIYLVTLVAVIVCCAALQWFLLTPIGRATILVKANEERARFLGYNVPAIKVVVMTLSATVAGVAGTLFALFQGLVSPGVFSFAPVGDVIFMALLGGTSSLFAPFAGAVGFILLEDTLAGITSHWRLIIALLSIVLVLYLPGGLYSIYLWISRRTGKPGVEVKPLDARKEA